MNINEFTESMTCSECGGPAFSDLILAEKKDACYNKVRSRYKVWPSAYASGALVQCRKKGAANWGNSKNEGVAEGSREQVDPSTVWEVSFDYGPHQSDKVKVRASSQEEAEQKGMRAAKKLGHRFPQLNWAMPVEQGVAEGNPIDTDWYRKQQERQTKAKQRQHSVEEGEKIGNMDADDFDAAMARLKKLAGAGPMKTVWDPARRQYRNMPTAVQPPKQPKK